MKPIISVFSVFFMALLVISSCDKDYTLKSSKTYNFILAGDTSSVRIKHKCHESCGAVYHVDEKTMDTFIDLNEDGINDMTLEWVSHYFTADQSHKEEGENQYGDIILLAGTQISVATDSLGRNVPKFFHAGQVINGSQSWGKVLASNISYSGPVDYLPRSLDEKYIGIRTIVKKDTSYGWMVIDLPQYPNIVLDSYAMNGPTPE